MHAIKFDNKLTKRNILSEIAKIFDPLGLLGPVVLYAKKLMQESSTEDRTCIRCFRHAADTVEYKMENLPQARVREAEPFANCGIDFCGPFHIKERKYRNRIYAYLYAFQ